MGREDYKEFGEKCGIPIKVAKFSDSDGTFNSDNEYLTIINTAIVKRKDLLEYYDSRQNILDIERNTLYLLAEELKRFKKEKGLKDFNDLLLDFIAKEKTNRFKVLFIDEAQDLSLLQWEMVRKLWSNAEKTYIAGDDDQAIYAWAGADVNRFIEEKTEGKYFGERILRKSRRISKAIQEQSEIPISRISGLRKQKEYLPRNYEGECKYISNLGQVDLTKGKWLILTRTKNQLLELMKELRKKNLYYQSNRGRSYKVRLYKAAKLYTDWTKGKILDEKEEKECKDFMGDEHFNRKSNWYDVFVAAPEKEIRYIRLMLENGENLDEDARIFMSTIHAIKGGEQDNVILSLHQGDKIQKSIKRSVDKRDEEHRVWYVGITRARNNLYKLKAKIKRKEYKL